MKTTFRQYLREDTQFYKTFEEVDNWLKSYSIENYMIDPKSLNVSVNGYVDLRDYDLEYLPVQFLVVADFFEIDRADKLKSLVGSPVKCGIYSCALCSSLVSLKGSPRECEDFDCSGCTSLLSLEDGPKKVKNNYDCENCPEITSLSGIPTDLDASLLALGTSIKTITGLDKILHSANFIQMDFDKVDGGLLSLLKISKLSAVQVAPVLPEGLRSEKLRIRKLIRIINTHLKSGKDIFACQQELIDAGLEEYAQL